MLVFARDNAAVEGYAQQLRSAELTMRLVVVLPAHVDATVDDALQDFQGMAQERYGGEPGVTYLIRPDQHVAARFAQFDVNHIKQAFRRALKGVH